MSGLLLPFKIKQIITMKHFISNTTYNRSSRGLVRSFIPALLTRVKGAVQQANAGAYSSIASTEWENGSGGFSVAPDTGY